MLKRERERERMKEKEEKYCVCQEVCFVLLCLGYCYWGISIIKMGCTSLNSWLYVDLFSATDHIQMQVSITLLLFVAMSCLWQ
jgi:hypothetical protein